MSATTDPLREIAEAALANKPHAQKWERHLDTLIKHVNPWNAHVATARTPEIAAHIATFDPPTALALLDALDALRAEVERLREALEKIAVSGNGGHWGRLARAALLPTHPPPKEGEDHAV